MTKNENEVAILLATYNSEEYIEELLNSILSQSNKNFTIFIRDDGSIDRTIYIICKFAEYNKNIVLLNDISKNIGPKLSFEWLLSNVDSKYYMFCDHDDVWFNYKIERSLLKLKELEKHLGSQHPILIHSDLTVTDKCLNIISPSFFKYAGINVDLSYKSIWNLVHMNCVTGCTMFFNQSVKATVLPFDTTAVMHDSWIALKVYSAKGILYCINEPLLFYRQHETNTLGANKKKNNFKPLSLKSFFTENYLKYKMINSIQPISLVMFFYRKLLLKFK